jgi:hypothetical protein
MFLSHFGALNAEKEFDLARNQGISERSKSCFFPTMSGLNTPPYAWAVVDGWAVSAAACHASGSGKGHWFDPRNDLRCVRKIGVFFNVASGGPSEALQLHCISWITFEVKCLASWDLGAAFQKAALIGHGLVIPRKKRYKEKTVPLGLDLD